MDRQSTIAFILIGVILVFWLYLNSPDPQTIQPSDQDTTLVNKPAETEPAPAENKLEEAFEDEKPVTDFEINTASVSDIPERIITIETDLSLIELTTKGARIKKFYLKEYKTWYYSKLTDSTNFFNSHVQLINFSRDGGDFNLVFVTKEGLFVNTKNLDFKSDLNEHYYRVKESDSLTIAFTYDSGENENLTKQFIFYGNDYNSKVDIVLDNMDDIISSYRYDLEWSNGINFVEENSVDESNYSNAAA